MDELRGVFLGQKANAPQWQFFRGRNTGEHLPTDLFADEESTYFDDVDQFLALQNQAVETLAEERRKTAAWVDVLHLHAVPWWQFRDAREEEPSGVVINLRPSGAVELREGLARHEVEPSVAQATRISPVAPRVPKERPAFGAELVRYTACQRSAAVQAALLENPRKAKEAVIVLLLAGFRRDLGLRLSFHECHAAPAAEQTQRSHRTIREATAHAISLLGYASDDAEAVRQHEVARLIDYPDVLRRAGRSSPTARR